MITPYSHSLRQPFQIKIGTIIGVKNTIKKIIGVALVLLILFVACLIPFTFITKQAVPNNNCCAVPAYIRPYSNQLVRQTVPDSPNRILPNPYYLSAEPKQKESLQESAYKETKFFIEQEVLTSRDFFSKDSSVIVEAIKNTNTFYTRLGEISGGMRKHMALLLNENVKISRKGLRAIFHSEGGAMQDIQHFNSLYDKLEKYDLLDNAMKYLNADELRVLKMLGYVACLPKEIDCKLNKLAGQIKELVAKIKNKETCPLAAAAYVHQEIIHMHPFKHGNRKTARIWMNIMLQMGGYKAIEIPKKDYADEIIKDRKSPGSFVSYLANIIEQSRRQTKIIYT